MKAFLKKYKELVIISAVVLLIVIYYIICSMMAVNRYLDDFNESYWSRQEDVDKKETVQMHRVPGYHELLQENGRLGGLVKLARNDSIGLFLDLTDSVAQLMVKGVSVRNIPLQEMCLGPLFSRANPEALYDLLSEPFRVINFKATIDKEPLHVVNAPKDSSDVIPSVKPDTTHAESVFFILETDKNLRFYFYQMEDGSPDAKVGYCFDLEDKWMMIKKTIRSVFAFKVPEYIPTIRIGVSKEDAKVLFRALPPQGQIVVTM